MSAAASERARVQRTQKAQTAVCNRHYSVDRQLCRWLLLSLDRLPSNRLVMTQVIELQPRQDHGG